MERINQRYFVFCFYNDVTGGWAFLPCRFWDHPMRFARLLAAYRGAAEQKGTLPAMVKSFGEHRHIHGDKGATR